MCSRPWLSGIVQAAMVPASAALLPSLVEDQEVRNAIALNSIQFNLSRVLGPVVGGLSLVYLRAAWNFTLNGISFLWFAATLLLIRSDPQGARSTTSVREGLVEGLAFVRYHRDVAAALALVFLGAFATAPVISMLPALVKSVHRRDSTSYSMLLGVVGTGAVVAAGAVAILDRGSRPMNRNVIACALLGLTEGVLAFAGPFLVVVGLVFTSGSTMR